MRFEKDGIDALADAAHKVNQTTQNIGARRLHTILERLLEEVSFESPERAEKTVVVNAAYVQKRLESILKDEDLSRFIL